MVKNWIFDVPNRQKNIAVHKQSSVRMLMHFVNYGQRQGILYPISQFFLVLPLCSTNHYCCSDNHTVPEHIYLFKTLNKRWILYYCNLYGSKTFKNKNTVVVKLNIVVYQCPIYASIFCHCHPKFSFVSYQMEPIGRAIRIFVSWTAWKLSYTDKKILFEKFSSGFAVANS